MPYIPQESRPSLDVIIDQLASEIVDQHKKFGYDGAFAGLMNYSFTLTILRTLKMAFGNIRYWQIAIISGVLSNISDEFYRRTAVPYEDLQIEKNGDVTADTISTAHKKSVGS